MKKNEIETSNTSIKTQLVEYVSNNKKQNINTITKTNKYFIGILAILISISLNKASKTNINKNIDVYNELNETKPHKNTICKLDEIIHFQIDRLILECRLGCGLSIRNIHKIIGGKYSIGYIQNLCTKAGKEAEKKMYELSNCINEKAITFIFDETFPKTIESGTIKLGVTSDEFGLIRGLNIIRKGSKQKDITRLIKDCLSSNYQPEYFISDYDKTYPKAVKTVLPNITICKDFVHSIRQILKYIASVMRAVHAKMNNSVKVTKKRQKEVTKLKKRLLKKKLKKILKYLYKGFSCKKVSVGTIYLEGFLSELENLSNKFKSLIPIYEKSKKFIEQYMEIWNLQMESYYRFLVPLTSNIIESKNSIFKSFSKKSKSFSKSKIKRYFCAVALYENFDIKTRGKNKGTSAMMRAGVDFDKFGAKDFFEAVGCKCLTKISIQDLKTLKNINSAKVS